MALADTIKTVPKPEQNPGPTALSGLLALARPLVMGILNVTPDSFSDGGKFLDPTTAISHAKAMAEQGADLLDIGAESTRPYGGMQPVAADDEKARLRDVLPAVVKIGLPVSIDTIKASIAAWALDQGATIVNDVWGLQKDPEMAKLVAARNVPVIVMHNREQADPQAEIIAEVTTFFERSLEIAARAGIARDRIVARPRHRLRQDAGAEHRLHRAACRIQAFRPAALGRGVAQALHQFGDAVAAGRTARRLAGGASAGGQERRGDRARARRGRDRAGAARRRGDRPRQGKLK